MTVGFGAALFAGFLSFLSPLCPATCARLHWFFEKS